MPVVPLTRHLVVVAPQLPDEETETNEDANLVMKCGRCRLTFVPHPSIGLGDSAKWRLCPPCRSRLQGNVSRTSSRWRRSDAATH
jgi:hypothetical protein